MEDKLDKPVPPPQGVIVVRDIALVNLLQRQYPKWLVVASSLTEDPIQFIEAP